MWSWQSFCTRQTRTFKIISYFSLSVNHFLSQIMNINLFLIFDLFWFIKPILSSLANKTQSCLVTIIFYIKPFIKLFSSFKGTVVVISSGPHQEKHTQSIHNGIHKHLIWSFVWKINPFFNLKIFIISLFNIRKRNQK